MQELGRHFGIAGLVALAAAAAVWGAGRFLPRYVASGEGPRAIGSALTWTVGVIMVSGWAVFPRLLGEPGKADLERFQKRRPMPHGKAMFQLREERASARSLALAFMIGLAAACATVRLGVRLEEKRLREKRSGTPFAAMMKRATVLFIVLTALAGLVSLFGAGPIGILAVMGLSMVWVQAGWIWRRAPNAGPLDPARSLACRAAFFGLAVSGIATVVFLAGFPRWMWAATGLWLGVGTTALLLGGTAWAATRLSPRTAVLAAGGAAGLVGLVLRIAV